MSLYGIDIIRCHAGLGQGAPNHLLLGKRVGSGQSVTLAIMVHGPATQQGNNRVPIPFRILQPFKIEHAAPFTPNIAVGMFTKSPADTIRREGIHTGKSNERTWSKYQVYPSSQGGVTLTGLKAFHRKQNGNH